LLRLFDESLRQFASQLADPRVLVRGEVHQGDGNVRERLRRWLDDRPSPIPIAQLAQLQ
jgi:hypothetical protein